MLEDMEDVCNRIVAFLKETCDRYGVHHAVVGVSGGIDSAVVLKLLVKALGKDGVLAVLLPESTTPRHAMRDARRIIRESGVRYVKHSISPMLMVFGAYFKLEAVATMSSKFNKYLRKKFEADIIKEDVYLHSLKYKKNIWVARETSFYRMKHRLRMVSLYYYAERNNAIVVGTANRSEFLTGFFVKYGDGAADVMPIIDLYKTEVYKLARYLSVPESIIDKSPSPDLIRGVTDEYAMGVSYFILDKILEALVDEKKSVKDVADSLRIPISLVKKVDTMIKLSEHMRVPFLSPGLR